MNKFLAISAAVFFVALQGCTEQKPAVNLSSGCALDNIEGAGRLPDGNYVSLPNSKLKAIGWMADVNLAQTPQNVTMILVASDGNVTSQGNGSMSPRPDVAAAFNKNGIANAGYTIGFELNKNLPNGVYEVVLNGVFGGRIAVCTTNKKLKIGD